MGILYRIFSKKSLFAQNAMVACNEFMVYRSLYQVRMRYTVLVITLTPYGITIAIVSFLGFVWARKRIKAIGFDDRTIETMAVIAAPAALFGARLHHVLTDWDLYVADVSAVFSIQRGGLGLWGALFAGLGMLYWYLKKHKQQAKPVFDAIALPLLFVLGTGRVANLLAGELYLFALASIITLVGAGCIIFIVERKNTEGRQHLFLFIAIIYSVTRFFLEFLRNDHIVGLLSVNQYVCILVIGCIVVYIIKRRNNERMT